MLAGRLWRHLLVRFSRFVGSGLGKRPDLRGKPGTGGPGKPGKEGLDWRALARSRNNISRLEVEVGEGEGAVCRPPRKMLFTF